MKLVSEVNASPRCAGQVRGKAERPGCRLWQWPRHSPELRAGGGEEKER